MWIPITRWKKCCWLYNFKKEANAELPKNCTQSFGQQEAPTSFAKRRKMTGEINHKASELPFANQGARSRWLHPPLHASNDKCTTIVFLAFQRGVVKVLTWISHSPPDPAFPPSSSPVNQPITSSNLFHSKPCENCNVHVGAQFRILVCHDFFSPDFLFIFLFIFGKQEEVESRPPSSLMQYFYRAGFFFFF